MAGEAARPATALSSLLADLHAAFAVTHLGPLPSEAALRAAAQHSGRQRPQAMRRPAVAGGPTGFDGRAAHLDASHAVSSPRSLFGQRWGLVGRWPALGGGQASQLPGAGARSFGDFSSQAARAAQARRAFATSPGKSLEARMGRTCAARRQRPKSARLSRPLRL